MAGRGPQTFKKRQKEQQRKEKQAEKLARRLQRKHEKPLDGSPGETTDDGVEESSEEPIGAVTEDGESSLQRS